MSRHKEVEIGGKKRPVSFGTLALAKFMDEAKMKLADIGKLSTDITLSHALILIKHGLKDGARKTGGKFTETIETIADWIDEDQSALERVLAVFSDSLPNEEAEATQEVKPGQEGNA